MFEEKFKSYLELQRRGAEGRRKEMLERDLAGTKMMVENVLLPVFGSFDDLILEHQMISGAGVSIFGDVFHSRLGIVFEEDHYVTHAEKITRDRFDFERARARSVAIFGYAYFPYSRDELLKKPELCRRDLYQLIGRHGTLAGAGWMQLPVFERELLRCGLMLNQPFRLGDVSGWLQMRNDTCRSVVRSLEEKGLVKPIGGGKARCYEFAITDQAVELLLPSRSVRGMS